MANIIGIDLGTTYSAVATFNKNGMPEIINDDTSASATLPSAVYYPPENENSVVIGAAAKEASVENPDRVFQFFKRWMAREDQEGYPHYSLDGRDLSPIELSAQVLKKVKEYAEASGNEITEAVITCPAYFTLEQREATKAAGKSVGINVLATINEPTAAALSYCFGKLLESKNVLVFDLGGGTFDVSLVAMTIDANGSMNAEVICTDGSAELGGKDWDEILTGILIDKFKETTGMEEVETEVALELGQMAESVKQKLTDMEETTAKIKVDGEKLKLKVSRAEFDAATKHKLDEAMNMLESVLAKAADAGYPEDKIDQVLLVGGSTKMNQVRDTLNDRFPGIVQMYDPDKAVACGAAIACKYIQDGIVSSALSAIVDKLSKGGQFVRKGDGTTVVVGPDGSETKVDSGVIDKETEEKLIKGEMSVSELEKEVQKNGPTMEIGNIGDVAPSTFGVIVRDGNRYVCMNHVFKGTKTPCENIAKYGAPGGDKIHLVLPVVQSDSTNEYDVVIRPDLSKAEYTFPDDSLNMKQVAMLQLDTVPGLTPGETVEVTVSFDALANLKVTMSIPATGDCKDCIVDFANVANVSEIAEHVSNTFIIDDN